MAQVLDTHHENIQQEGVRRQRMSYEDYLTYGNDTTRSEWVDGETIVYVPPRDEHQIILGFLYRLLSLFADIKEIGRVQIAPFEVKLWEEGPSREPDLLFISKENLENLSSKRFSGAPDLAVEIISPGSLYIDRDKKFREYEQAGIKEYWLVDSRPGHKRADFYRLDEEKRYALFATESDETVTSEVLVDFWLRPAWLWQEPPSNPLVAVAEVVGQDAIMSALTKNPENTSTKPATDAQ